MKRLRKFLHLSSSERRLLVQASLLLGAIRLGLSLLPLQTLRRVLAHLTQAPAAWPKADPASPGLIVWAVTRSSRYVPGATCLARALAVQVLLERQGYPAHLRIGVARSARRRLEGHAWVEHQGQIIIGGGFVPDVLLPALEEDGSHGG